MDEVTSFPQLCGTLLRKEVTVTYVDPITREPSQRPQHLRQTDIPAREGDSGGSVFDGSHALGLIAAQTGEGVPPSYFQPIERALNAVGGYTIVTREPRG